MSAFSGRLTQAELDAIAAADRRRHRVSPRRPYEVRLAAKYAEFRARHTRVIRDSRCCPQCGKRFHSRAANAKYCSRDCSNRYYDAHVRERRLNEAVRG
jgi:NADH pyrophosphatase NudC (nudix superfamily)